MPLLRTLLLALAVVLALPAAAGELRPYGDDAFDAALAAGRPVIVHVTAPWCPTCRAQKPVIGALLDSPDNPDLLVLEVDFDTARDTLRRFGVRSQSTLIAFRDGSEVDRSVGVTDPARLAAFVASTR